MVKENLLQEYQENVEKIRIEAKCLGFDDEEINKLIKESFKDFQYNNFRSSNHKSLKLLFKIQGHSFKISALILFLSIFIYVLLNVHTPTSSIVLRNVQGLTYPALKIVRTLSVPIIRLFPSLTDLYDESCLVENPYFYVSDMECWPCEGVVSIIDLTGIQKLNNFEKIGEGTPFIAKINQSIISLKKLQELYQNYSIDLESDSRRLKITNSDIKNLKLLFNTEEPKLSSNLHIQWRINKMTAARIIRRLFKKPYFLAERSGQAVERFLSIDGPESGPYELPNTECSYAFIIQGSGERTIALKPSNECRNKCKTISVVLKPSHVLFYNWWYWRPVSLPVKNATNLSISYINSYC